MNRNVNAIGNRLSLRSPQRESLEILHRVMEIAHPAKNSNAAVLLERIRGEYPTVQDFERDFPSLCFALATGVGKTRLMGAFISYLHIEHGLKNFFVLAPNLTIYNKLIADFTHGTPKYVFRGIAEFAVNRPLIITGETYNNIASIRGGRQLALNQDEVHINIFNISKINTEVRGGKSPRIKRLSEYIGQSYFDYLAELPDLVLLMDESHRYRASAGERAINELRPLIGLELTATPFVESSRGPTFFKNVIYHYSLARAMADGFVKEPAVVTRKDFNPSRMAQDELEQLKLEDGVRLHEQTKVHLETYARQYDQRIVKPFMLVIARDTVHAARLIELIESEAFFDGRYRGKAIQVDSSQTGAKEDAMIERLLRVEHDEEPTEIVVHVNMLKEGWDVTNLYTIVPLRAAKARTLIEQSIGRGLRLPYGCKTGVIAVDRLSIVAHDRFQEIVDEANRGDSLIRLQQLELNADELSGKPKTVVSMPNFERQLGFQPAQLTASTALANNPDAVSLFDSADEQGLARITYEVIRGFENKPDIAPGSLCLQQPQLMNRIAEQVQQQSRSARQDDVRPIVQKTIAAFVQQNIDIPRIVLQPKGEDAYGFNPFTLDLRHVHYQPPSDELWLQYLRTGENERIGFDDGGMYEARLENYIVFALIDFNDISYVSHAELLYDLAAQAVAHLRSYIPGEEQLHRLLRVHRRELAQLIHTQMQEHSWEKPAGFEVCIRQGFSELKPCAYAMMAGEDVLNFTHSPADKSNMAKYLFGGFQHCLYPVQKFDSEAERILAGILDREADKWFRPARGQFHIYYKLDGRHHEYLPDFVAETQETMLILEAKARNRMDDAEVQRKKEAAMLWCQRASEHTASYAGKPWQYGLIPHNELALNMSLLGLIQQFCV